MEIEERYVHSAKYSTTDQHNSNDERRLIINKEEEDVINIDYRRRKMMIRRCDCKLNKYKISYILYSSSMIK